MGRIFEYKKEGKEYEEFIKTELTKEERIARAEGIGQGMLIGIIIGAAATITIEIITKGIL